MTHDEEGHYAERPNVGEVIAFGVVLLAVFAVGSAKLLLSPREFWYQIRAASRRHCGAWGE